MLNFNVCVRRGGGGGGGGRGLFYVVAFNAILSNSELNTKSFSYQTNRIWKNIVIDNIFSANIFI